MKKVFIDGKGRQTNTDISIPYAEYGFDLTSTGLPPTFRSSKISRLAMKYLLVNIKLILEGKNMRLLKG